MSEILLGTNPSNPQIIGMYRPNATAEDKAKQLPRPSGYRILCAIPEIDKEFEDSEIGLIKADETLRMEETLTTVLFVVELGPDCYKDDKRFPSGPWCKKGDWIVFGRYSGARVPIDGGEIRIINDDEVLATIQNPEDILHM